MGECKEELKKRVNDLENETHQLMNEARQLMDEAKQTIERAKRVNEIVMELARQENQQCCKIFGWDFGENEADFTYLRARMQIPLHEVN